MTTARDTALKPIRESGAFFGPALVILYLLSGCVRTEVGRNHPGTNPLTVGRDMHGVRLTLLTEKGLRYHILYRDPGQTEWRPLPQATNFVGTGGPMEFRDHPPPSLVRHRAYSPKNLDEHRSERQSRYRPQPLEAVPVRPRGR